MKQIILLSLLLLTFTSCKKEDDKEYYDRLEPNSWWVGKYLIQDSLGNPAMWSTATMNIYEDRFEVKILDPNPDQVGDSAGISGMLWYITSVDDDIIYSVDTHYNETGYYINTNTISKDFNGQSMGDCKFITETTDNNIQVYRNEYNLVRIN